MFSLFKTAMDEATYPSGWEPLSTQQESIIFDMDIQKDKYTYIVDHHLEHQERLIGHPNPTHLRFRQILAHHYLRAVPGSVSHTRILTGLIMSGLELMFKHFLEEAQATEDEEQALSDLALKFLFECYSLKESIEIGLFKSGDLRSQHIKLGSLLSLADDTINQVVYRHWFLEQRFSSGLKESKVSLPVFRTRKQFSFDKVYPAFWADIPTGKDSLLIQIVSLIQESYKIEKEYKSHISSLFEDVQESKLIIRKVENKYDTIDVCRALSRWVQKIIYHNPQIIQSSVFTNFLRIKNQVFDKFYLHSYIPQSNPDNSTLVPNQDQILESLIQVQIDIILRQVYLKKQREYLISGVLRSTVQCNINEALEVMKKNDLRIIEIVERPHKVLRSVSVCYLMKEGVPAQLLIYQPPTVSSKLQRLDRLLNEIQSDLFGPVIEFILKCIRRNGKEYLCSLQPSGKIQTKEIYSLGKVRPAINELKCPVGHYPFVMLSCADLQRNDEMCRHCCCSLIQLKAFFHCFKCSSSYCTRCYSVSQVSKTIETLQKPLCQFIAHEHLKSDTLKVVLFHLVYSPASILIQYFLQNWTKLYFNGQLYQVDISDEFNQEKDNLIKVLEITRFPCFVLYKGNTPIKKITGASVYHICQMLSLLANEDKLALTTSKCLNSHNLQLKILNSWTQWSCTQCKKHSKPNEKFLYCGRCPYFLCFDCSFIQSEGSFDYHDGLGMSYLSTPRNYLYGEKECPNSHKMTLMRVNPYFSPKYSCNQCQRLLYFNGEYGMWLCKQCQKKMCHICSELLLAQPDRDEYASHHVLRTATNLKPCQNCHEHMVWTYSSHKKNQSGEQWQCSACFEKLHFEQLHLVCLRCSTRVCHKQSCRKSYAKNDSPEIQKKLCKSCPGGEIIKRSSLKSQQKQFTCSICKSKYYRKTLHYECLSCKDVKYCKSCKITLLKDRLKKLKLICMSECDGKINVDEFEGEFDVDMTMSNVRKEFDRNQRCSMRILSNNVLENFDDQEKKVGDLQNEACLCLFKSKKVQSCLQNTVPSYIANSKIMKRRSTILSFLSSRSAAHSIELSIPSNPLTSEISLNSDSFIAEKNTSAGDFQSKNSQTIASTPVKHNGTEPYSIEGSYIRHRRLSISIPQEKHGTSELKGNQQGSITEERAESELSEPVIIHKTPELASKNSISVESGLEQFSAMETESVSKQSNTLMANLVTHIKHAQSMQGAHQPKH